MLSLHLITTKVSHLLHYCNALKCNVTFIFILILVAFPAVSCTPQDCWLSHRCLICPAVQPVFQTLLNMVKRWTMLLSILLPQPHMEQKVWTFGTLNWLTETYSNSCYNLLCLCTAAGYMSEETRGRCTSASSWTNESVSDRYSNIYYFNVLLIH